MRNTKQSVHIEMCIHVYTCKNNCRYVVTCLTCVFARACCVWAFEWMCIHLHVYVCLYTLISCMLRVDICINWYNCTYTYTCMHGKMVRMCSRVSHLCMHLHVMCGHSSLFSYTYMCMYDCLNLYSACYVWTFCINWYNHTYTYKCMHGVIVYIYTRRPHIT